MILVIGAVLRLWAVQMLGARAGAHGDEWQYVRAAYSIVDGAGYPDTFRPPMFPALLALGFALGGKGLIAGQLAQLPVGLATIALVFALARARFGCRAALLAAGLVAVNPTLVNYTHFLWSETLCGMFLAALVLGLDRFDLTRREAWLVFAGVALGLGALTREEVLFLLPIPAAWLLLAHGDVRTRCRRLALLVVPVLLLVGSWTVRNALSQGRFVLISTARWAPIAEGLLGDRTALLQQLAARRDDANREAFARDVAITALHRIGPRDVLKKLWAGPMLLFSVDNQTGRFVRERWFPAASAPAARSVARLEVYFYVATTLLAVLGLWLVPGGRTKSLIVLTLVFFVAVHTLSIANHRHRVLLLPLLTLYVGPLLCGAGLRPRGASWRWLGATVTSALFLLVVWQSLATPEVRRIFFSAGTPQRERALSPRARRRELRYERRLRQRGEEGGPAPSAAAPAGN